ncbi:zinc finger protein 28-like [Trichogramma pretiosum]|uniref:zinc finger protein 28-like n=1 Tax=Trichogramma pretiosum TaxID=7493 RepID=UPI0006C97718|nr:zinc finger protein 28-like [Trichogramma pretiosum]XP_014232526.1 zinc finger protein 28-like [Trichogramma pretiosum]
MNDDDSTVVTGAVETIEIKPELTELLIGSKEESHSEEESSSGSNFEHNSKKCSYVTVSGEVIDVETEDIVQTPFFLESYFLDKDEFRDQFLSAPCMEERVIEIDRVTCYECDTAFCSEQRLLEHLMKHIDVYKMGCNICDKDLNLEEKFQLHMMAVTWQSIYYCDICRKSCAGVVRSKSQPPPPGKIYMCHDCEYFTKQENLKFNSIRFHLNIECNAVNCDPPRPPPILPLPTPPPLPPPQPPPPPAVPIPPQQSISAPTEVLQDNKQKLVADVKLDDCNGWSTKDPSSEIYDSVVCKVPPKKKENMRCRGPKPRVKVVSESMRHTLKMSSRVSTRASNKLLCKYKCKDCPISFADEGSLIKHVREKHSFHKINYECKLCGKDFSQQRCYENHMNYHQRQKNHICFVCNDTFISKRKLEQHTCHKPRSKFLGSHPNEGAALDLRKKKTKNAAR